jgi:hypothetical protein
MLFFLISSVFAHSGGTDAYGCHSGSEPYHCHDSSVVLPMVTPSSVSLNYELPTENCNARDWYEAELVDYHTHLNDLTEEIGLLNSRNSELEHAITELSEMNQELIVEGLQYRQLLAQQDELLTFYVAYYEEEEAIRRRERRRKEALYALRKPSIEMGLIIGTVVLAASASVYILKDNPFVPQPIEQ